MTEELKVEGGGGVRVETPRPTCPLKRRCLLSADKFYDLLERTQKINLDCSKFTIRSEIHLH